MNIPQHYILNKLGADLPWFEHGDYINLDLLTARSDGVPEAILINFEGNLSFWSDNHKSKDISFEEAKKLILLNFKFKNFA